MWLGHPFDEVGADDVMGLVDMERDVVATFCTGEGAESKKHLGQFPSWFLESVLDSGKVILDHKAIANGKFLRVGCCCHGLQQGCADCEDLVHRLSVWRSRSIRSVCLTNPTGYTRERTVTYVCTGAVQPTFDVSPKKIGRAQSGSLTIGEDVWWREAHYFLLSQIPLPTPPPMLPFLCPIFRIQATTTAVDSPRVSKDLVLPQALPPVLLPPSMPCLFPPLGVSICPQQLRECFTPYLPVV